MKFLVYFIIILLPSFQLLSQILTIKDSETMEAIEMAVIAGEKLKTNIMTNSKGQADISQLKGVSKIQIRKFGFVTILTSFAEIERDSFQLMMKPSGISLDELVISAIKWNQNLRDNPSKVITISQTESSFQNPQTAADLLTISGKVFVQKSQQGGGSPMIRGFATNRLLYTIDGVRMNTAIFRSGNIQNVISLDPFAIEKSEVLFGPGSVIYGSDAIGGVMSFSTLTPQFSTSDKAHISGHAAVRYSSANDENTAHFDVNAGWKEFASLTSISINKYNDLRMGRYGPGEYLRPIYVERYDTSDIVVANADPLIQTPSGYSQINIMQKFRYRLGYEWEVNYGFHYSETSDYSRYDRHIRYRNGLPRYGEWYYGPQKWLMHNLNFLNTSESAIYDHISINAALQEFEESRIDRDFNKSIRHRRIEKVDAYSINIDLNKSLTSDNSIFYGAEYVLNNVNSIGIDEDISTALSIPGPARYPLSEWSSLAIYINDQHKFSDEILVQAGIRFNQFSIDADFDTSFYPFPFSKAEINKSAFIGSLGIVYRPASDFVLSANLSNGFRAPNIDDIGKIFDSEPGAVTVPNPDLEAEYAVNFDFGVAKVFSETVKIDLTGYYTNLNNAMVRRNFSLNGSDSIIYSGEMSRVQAIQNAAVARVWGVQAGIEAKLGNGFTLSGDFNYQKGEEELDDGSISPSRHAAPMFGQFKLIYAFQKLMIQFYAYYSGEKQFTDMPEEEQGKPELYAIDINGNPWSPSWYTLNFKASIQLNEQFSIQAGLENITDRRYRPYSSGITSAGRNFIMSLKAKF